MRKHKLLIVIIFSCCLLNAAELTPNGSPSTELFLDVDKISYAKIGFSSTRVDELNPEPTPITGDIILSDDNGLVDNELVGSGSCYLYWDIFTPSPVQAKAKIDSGAMTLATNEATKLDWALAVTWDNGHKEYIGANSLRNEFEDINKYGDKEYDSEVNVFDPDGSSDGTNHQFYRIGSSRVDFLTADASRLARGSYEGIIKFEFKIS